jgi:hypothetical protein
MFYKTFYSIILYINDAMECDVQKITNATSNKPQIEASVSRQKDKRTLHRIQQSTTFDIILYILYILYCIYFVSHFTVIFKINDNDW